jgi:hypothetical protein
MILADAHGAIAVFDTWPTGAAHSMDTDWYGIDQGGNVARLQSGEEGAVPYAAHRQYWDELYEDLMIARVMARAPADPQAAPATLRRALAAARDPVEIQILGAILGGDETGREIYADFLEQHGRALPRSVYVVEHELREIEPSALPHEWSGILRFQNREYLELYRSEYHYDEWRPLVDRIGIPAAAAQRIQQWAFDDYWSAGAITAAYMIERPIEPHLVGLYEYGCSFNGPYDRREVPADPLLLDELPEPLREIFAQLRIPVRFATTESFDPVVWFDCQLYRT